MRISKRGVPAAAVLASTVVGFVTVGLNYIAPDTVFLFLVNTSGAIALFVWLVIAGSQLILRRRMGAAAKDLQLKMWLFPYLTWVAIVSIVALLIGMVILESTRESLLLSLALAAVVVGIGLWRYRKQGGEVPGDAAAAGPRPARAPASPRTPAVGAGHGAVAPARPWRPVQHRGTCPVPRRCSGHSATMSTRRGQGRACPRAGRDMSSPRRAGGHVQRPPAPGLLRASHSAASQEGPSQGIVRLGFHGRMTTAPQPPHEPHPDHDRGLEFDLSTLLSRRSLGMFLGAGAAAALAACTPGGSSAGCRPPQRQRRRPAPTPAASGSGGGHGHRPPLPPLRPR